MMPTKKYCPNCGAPVEGVRFCGNCGTNLFTGPYGYAYPPVVPLSPSGPSEQERKTGETYGIGSIVCGVVGLITFILTVCGAGLIIFPIFSIVFGVIAIVLGLLAREKEAKSMGNIGIVLGLIDIVLVLSIVTLFVYLWLYSPL